MLSGTNPINFSRDSINQDQQNQIISGSILIAQRQTDNMSDMRQSVNHAMNQSMNQSLNQMQMSQY